MEGRGRVDIVKPQTNRQYDVVAKALLIPLTFPSTVKMKWRKHKEVIARYSTNCLNRFIISQNERLLKKRDVVITVAADGDAEIRRRSIIRAGTEPGADPSESALGISLPSR